MMFRKSIAVVASIVLSVGLATGSASAAKPHVVVKAGGVCSKVGAVTTISHVRFVCTKNTKTKKLAWVKKAVVKKAATKKNAGVITYVNASALPACPSGTAFLNHLPMSAADLTGIEPLGHMNGEHILPNQADHIYLKAQPSQSTTVLYAPGDVTLLQAQKGKGLAGVDIGKFKMLFSHLAAVSCLLYN